ncbi:hypothetical protein Ddc_10128 [Ditylenchus destructor]|nr:hypothetical protein Ddc_10128 [Ditylenchus destructor]
MYMGNVTIIISPSALVFVSLNIKLCRNKFCRRNLAGGIFLSLIGTIVLAAWLDHQGEHLATDNENAVNNSDSTEEELFQTWIAEICKKGFPSPITYLSGFRSKNNLIVKVRSITEGDMSQVEELHKVVWPDIDTYTGVYCTFAFGAFIEEKTNNGITIEHLVGAIALNDVVPFRQEEYTRILTDNAEKYGYITYFLTHPDKKYRGQGIGSNLYRQVLAEYKKRYKRDKYGLFLDVGQEKLQQKKMYEHLGLRKVGEFGYGESDVDDVYAITWNKP